ncbi:hypothetical protein [Rahnella sp. Larv3_ips]|uniref:hypothetical protein n=1 Tax=Rahnella sp. Larv3_ips TaxID=1896943 RepID=UPI000EFACB5F|nr:hypothetical protein [Rahnella sp. Larv3_ips]
MLTKIVMIFTFFLAACCYAEESLPLVKAGIMILNTDKTYMLLTTEKISATDIVYINPAIPDDIKCCEKITGSNFRFVGVTQKATDELEGKEIMSYLLTVTYPSRQLNKPTMALIVKRNSLIKIAPKIESNANEISFNIMSVNYKFSICNSQEGLHVYSKGTNSKEHLYLPLGYEVQPNCPEEAYY